MQGNEPHDYAYVLSAFHSCDISLHFIFVPLLCDFALQFGCHALVIIVFLYGVVALQLWCCALAL